MRSLAPTIARHDGQCVQVTRSNLPRQILKLIDSRMVKMPRVVQPLNAKHPGYSRIPRSLHSFKS